MYLKNRNLLNIFASVSVSVALTFVFASCSNKTVLPQRADIMQGAPNFRDLGGYQSKDGKQVVWRKIFRSQTLAHLTDSDVIKMKELGVKTVIDFRSDAEVLQEPSRLPAGIKTVRLPIEVSRNDSTLQIMQLLMTGALDSAQCVEFMQTANRKFVTEFAPQYKDFFDVLLQPKNYPIVFHCTAGKDRTGFAAAMLLSAIEVDWDTVMDDYLLTNKYLKPQSLMSQIPESAMPALRQMFGVKASYLNAAKEEITNHYGNINNYLSIELNVGESEKNRLKELLLE